MCEPAAGFTVPRPRYGSSHTKGHQHRSRKGPVHGLYTVYTASQLFVRPDSCRASKLTLCSRLCYSSVRSPQARVFRSSMRNGTRACLPQTLSLVTRSAASVAGKIPMAMPRLHKVSHHSRKTFFRLVVGQHKLLPFWIFRGFPRQQVCDNRQSFYRVTAGTKTSTPHRYRASIKDAATDVAVASRILSRPGRDLLCTEGNPDCWRQFTNPVGLLRCGWITATRLFCYNSTAQLDQARYSGELL